MLIWLTWFRWIVLMAALGLIVFLGYRASPWNCIDVTVTAYWVQAVGSIGAIFGAFFLGERQANKALATALRMNFLAEKKRLESFFAICTAGEQRARLVSEIFCADKFDAATVYLKYDNSLITGIIDALVRIPTHELGSADAVLALMEMTDQFRFVLPCIERVRDGYHTVTAEQRANMNASQERVAAHIKSILKQYEILKGTIGKGE